MYLFLYLFIYLCIYAFIHWLTLFIYYNIVHKVQMIIKFNEKTKK